MLTFNWILIGYFTRDLPWRTMDPKKSIDDQFLKLHPGFPVETRIAIVGAGPSGLSTAYALAKLGYCNVTVFEKCRTVAGMCESVDIEGEKYSRHIVTNFL